jgi:uncharacterized protein YndB with AHSA1/START domain
MSKKNKVSSGKKPKIKPAKGGKDKKAKNKPVKKSKDKQAAKPKAKQAKKPAPKKPLSKKPAPKKPIKVAKSNKIASKNIKVKDTKKASTVKKTTSKKIAKPSKSVSKNKLIKKAIKVAVAKNKVAKPIAKKTVTKISEPTKPFKPVSNATPVKVAKAVETKKSNTISTQSEPKPILKKPLETQEVEKITNPKNSENKEVLAITNNIPKQVKEEISTSKINSISSSITNPIKTNDAYAVKFEKEPNGKYELEFVVKSSADLLFEFLYTSSGLSEWFCDDVNIRNGIYTFVWDGQLQQARLLKTIENQLVRFQWVDKVDGSYFEFRIQKDELTNDISLIITDFAENTQDANSSKLLWQSQVDKLLHVIGSIF